MSDYLLRIYQLPETLEDSFTGELWLQGTLGTQSFDLGDGTVRLEAYFAAGEASGKRSPNHPVSYGRIRLLAEKRVPARDWMAAYRAQVQPFRVGRIWWIDPREPGAEGELPGSEMFRLRLPARSAFGIGSHESTRLALELLEEADPAGLRVLDVGTGTGILTFASLLLGARAAVGIDTDLTAALLAQQNAELNRLPASFVAGRLAALKERSDFDLAVVNILPQRILPELSALLARLRADAALIFSGILWRDRMVALGPLQNCGLRTTTSRRAGGWVAYQMQRIDR